MNNTKSKSVDGIIIRITGPVVDVRFPDDLPSIHEALIISLKNKEELTLEVAFAIGDNEVKTLAMGPTDGLCRGMKVKRTFSPILVPVGQETLGRIFNVLGKPIDGKGIKVDSSSLDSIHKNAPLL